MRTFAVLALVSIAAIAAPTPAFAQRLPFERVFDVDDAPTLRVSTIRGKIDVTVGEPGRIVVVGEVTIRAGWDVPANAADLARTVADRPPVAREGSTIRLSPPAESAERRAVTVSYRVTVPPNTDVQVESESGATTVHGVSGPVAIRTQSGAIELSGLGGTANVTSGSGSIAVDGIAGALAVTTSSSAFTGQSLQGDVRLRTASGAVNASLTGSGNVDVETGSGAIRLNGLRGGLNVSTQSGSVTVQGAPSRPWRTSTGSGRVVMTVDGDAGYAVEASSRSGSVTVSGVTVDGTVSKRRVAGTIGSGGPLIAITSGSGSIRLTVATR